MKTLPYLMILIFLYGCVAGDGEGLDENGQPFTVPSGEQTPPDDNLNPLDPEPPMDEIVPTLASLQENILSPICAQCHFGTSPPAGLRMDSLEASFDNLVNIAATLNPTYNRVTPGDADNSFLFLKIIGDPVAGNRMPLGLPALDNETIEIFREWINSGAPIDETTPVVSNVGIVQKNATQRLAITFSKAINPSTITASQVNMVLTDKNGESMPIYPNLSVEEHWETPEIFTFPIFFDVSNAKRLAISFNDDAISTVIDSNGYLLDGDFTGTNGGEYHHEINF